VGRGGAPPLVVGRLPDHGPPLRVARMKNRLHVLRAEHDWSQAELAERLSVSRQTVNAIENDRYDPSLPLAFAIARVFSLRIEDVFTPE
jgi:putative transcriptional regulator